MSTSPAKLAQGFAVRLNRQVLVSSGGRELVGGSPTRALYLSQAASAMVVEKTVTVSDANTHQLVDRLLETGMADPVLDSLADIDPASVTVVVPVFGRAIALDRLLASVGCQYQVIVVDDASPDAQAIREVTDKYGARLVRLSANAGVSHARNEGLKRVTTPYVAFADSDVVLSPETIPILLKHFHDTRVALAGPRVLGLDEGGGRNWIERYEAAKSSLDLGRYPATVRPRSPVSWLPGAFLIAKVDALAHGFDEDSRVGEDVDLVWRLVEQGWRVRFEPEAKVWHEHRQNAIEWLSRKAFYGTSAHTLSARYPKATVPAVFAPWSAAAVVAILCQRSWSIPVAGALTAYAGWQISKKLDRSEEPGRLAATLATRGVMAAHSQTIALFVRHWWPLAVGASIVSPRLRRALLASCLIDAVVEYRRTKPDLDPIRFTVARRLDDIAYGAGVWYSAIRGRSWRCLLPDITSRSKTQ